MVSLDFFLVVLFLITSSIGGMLQPSGAKKAVIFLEEECQMNSLGKFIISFTTNQGRSRQHVQDDGYQSISTSSS